MELETHEQARIRVQQPLQARLAQTPAKVDWQHYVEHVKRELVSHGDKRLDALSYPFRG